MASPWEKTLEVLRNVRELEAAYLHFFHIYKVTKHATY